MARRVGEGQRGNHGWLVNRPTTVLLIPVAAVQPSRDLEHHHETSNGEGGCGGSPLTLVTTALAMFLSLTLPFWDAVRNIASASAPEAFSAKFSARRVFAGPNAAAVRAYRLSAPTGLPSAISGSARHDRIPCVAACSSNLGHCSASAVSSMRTR